MSEGRSLRIAVVAGEESGDLLGADLVAALGVMTGRKVELIGVGGRHLEAAGLKSLFNASDIALMGVTAVLRDLPRLVRRIGQTASAILQEAPDCLITIDSPDFSLRVARKVRAGNPSIPIVHYVCPSVWAWRPGRALAMRPYVDRLLCILPFEPAALERLDGPPGTFVGHRLSSDEGILSAAAAQESRPIGSRQGRKRLLVLPGSRRSEVRRLIGPFGEIVGMLAERGHQFEISMPMVPHLAELVQAGTGGWSVRPEIVVDPARKWRAFGEADAAIAASGTVSLELALSRVPLISCYKIDPLLKPILKRTFITWSASLPNLIADWPAVPEYYDEYIRPAYLARLIEKLWSDTPARASQLAGFDDIAARLATARPSGEMAAGAILAEIERRRK